MLGLMTAKDSTFYDSLSEIEVAFDIKAYIRRGVSLIVWYCTLIIIMFLLLRYVAVCADLKCVAAAYGEVTDMAATDANTIETLNEQVNDLVAVVGERDITLNNVNDKYAVSVEELTDIKEKYMALMNGDADAVKELIDFALDNGVLDILNVTSSVDAVSDEQSKSRGIEVDPSVYTPYEYHFTREELELLAKTVQCEAGHYANADESQKLVTQVIMNRVLSSDFPDTITEVIYQPGQFSVAYNGAIENCVVTEDTYKNVLETLLVGSGHTDVPLLYFNMASGGTCGTEYDTVQGTVFATE